MGSRIPLPPHLLDAPFTVDSALQSGLGQSRLRGPDLDRIWGVRAAKATRGGTELERRCGMFRERMPPDSCFSHATAAGLMGVPLPHRGRSDDRVHIAVHAPARAPHATGLIGHSLRLREGDVRYDLGLPRTTAARTWCDLAATLTLPDLVAAGDHLIHWRSPMVSIVELQRVASDFVGLRGMSRMRLALPLLDDRAESPPESVMRVVFDLAGLPRPKVNFVIVNTETGQDFRTDLAYPEYLTLIEYQGDYHRSQAQWRRDLTRRARLEAQGWFVMEVNADDLRNPEELVARVRSVLHQRGWRG